MNIRSRSGREWRLLALATLTLSSYVVLTRLLPYRFWRRLGSSISRTRRNAPTSDMVVRALDGASVLVPGGGNCLARALAGRVLLSRYGVSSEIVLGVAKAADGSLKAHAWLRREGRTLLGEQGVSGFQPMPDLAGRL